MKKKNKTLRPGDSRQYAQGHTVCKWQIWDLNPDLSGSLLAYYMAKSLVKINKGKLEHKYTFQSTQYRGKEAWIDVHCNLRLAMYQGGGEKRGFFMGKVLSSSWSSPNRLGWLVSKPQVSTCFCLPSAGIIVNTTTLELFHMYSVLMLVRLTTNSAISPAPAGDPSTPSLQPCQSKKPGSKAARASFPKRKHQTPLTLFPTVSEPY